MRDINLLRIDFFKSSNLSVELRENHLFLKINYLEGVFQT